MKGRQGIRPGETGPVPGHLLYSALPAINFWYLYGVLIIIRIIRIILSLTSIKTSN